MTACTGPIPEFFSQFTSLTLLTVSSNRFSGIIPSAVLALPSLVLANFSDNLFTDFAINETVGIANLRMLIMSNNQINHTFSSEAKVTPSNSLEVLSLSSNSISNTIDQVLVGVQHLAPYLVSLDLSHNSIRSFPQSQSNSWSLDGPWTMLSTLNLANNLLTDPLWPDSEQFQWFATLSSLNISSNPLTAGDFDAGFTILSNPAEQLIDPSTMLSCPTRQHFIPK